MQIQVKFLSLNSLVSCNLDSVFLSLSETEIDDLVKPEMREEYFRDIKPKWFVLDETPEQQREPGLLKTEFSTTNGSAVMLTPKCYHLLDNQTQELKLASKGISTKNVEIEHNDFLLALYQNKKKVVTECKMQFNQSEWTMETLKMKKNALNTNFTKLRLNSDNVTISPLYTIKNDLIQYL